MKKKIESIIKNNSVINKIYTTIGSLIVKFLGLFVQKEEGLVLFVSYMGKNFNDSPKAIYDEMVSRGLQKSYDFVWAFNSPDKYEDNIEGSVVKMDSFKYLIVALKAEYWITNVNIERGLHFKKIYTHYINTWHGIPLKLIGNDVSGRLDFDFSTVDLFCYSGVYEFEKYANAFGVKNNSLKLIGMPRNDVFKKVNAELEKEARRKLNVGNKITVLYAPTWRENKQIPDIINLKIITKNLPDNYVLLVKAHGLSNVELHELDNYIDVSDYEETNEVLLATDILITDYSSILFDFSLLGRPISLYVPDYEEYEAERGLYIKLEELNLTLSTTEESLIEWIINHNKKEEIKKSREIYQNFFNTEENATNYIVNSFFCDKKNDR